MLNLNLLEKLTFKCFLCGAPDPDRRNKNDEMDDIDRKIYNVTREYKVSILPITPNFDIDNLYPLTDHVELWNIFIVGNDKTYILANVNDSHIMIPNASKLPNHKGTNILSEELLKIFDNLWARTLQGRQLQFYMVWNSKLYFVNTYPFFNGKEKVIGAILFMRAFETMPETRFTSLDGHTIMPVRYSSETVRETMKEIVKENTKEHGKDYNYEYTTINLSSGATTDSMKS